MGTLAIQLVFFPSPLISPVW